MEPLKNEDYREIRRLIKKNSKLKYFTIGDGGYVNRRANDTGAIISFLPIYYKRHNKIYFFEININSDNKFKIRKFDSNGLNEDLEFYRNQFNDKVIIEFEKWLMDLNSKVILKDLNSKLIHEKRKDVFKTIKYYFSQIVKIFKNIKDINI